MDQVVMCECPEVPITPISDILAPVYHEVAMGPGKTVRMPLPFNNASYRTAARVVNFYPGKLEDFSRFRLVNEFDCLSGDEDGDVASWGEESYGTLKGHAGRGKWEWQFDLELEDTSSETDTNRGRMWVHVDNAAAQLLTGLDATE
jgi:protection of telomeres protein 1